MFKIITIFFIMFNSLFALTEIKPDPEIIFKSSNSSFEIPFKQFKNMSYPKEFLEFYSENQSGSFTANTEEFTISSNYSSFEGFVSSYFGLLKNISQSNENNDFDLDFFYNHILDNYPQYSDYVPFHFRMYYHSYKTNLKTKDVMFFENIHNNPYITLKEGTHFLGHKYCDTEVKGDRLTLGTQCYLDLQEKPIEVLVSNVRTKVGEEVFLKDPNFFIDFVRLQNAIIIDGKCIGFANELLFERNGRITYDITPLSDTRFNNPFLNPCFKSASINTERKTELKEKYKNIFIFNDNF